MEFAIFVIAVWGLIELMYAILGTVVASATLILLGEIVVLLIVCVVVNKMCDNIFTDDKLR